MNDILIFTTKKEAERYAKKYLIKKYILKERTNRHGKKERFFNVVRFAD